MSCETCNDERELHVDRFDPVREHHTIAIPCPDCVRDADDAALDTYLETRLEFATLGSRVAALGRLEPSALETRLELGALAPEGR